MTNLEKYKNELERLIKMADLLSEDLTMRNYSPEKIKSLSKEKKELHKKINGAFESTYQSWFTEAMQVIKQIIPDRLEEFIELYKTDPKRKQIFATNFSIQDWLNGTRSATNNFSGEKYFNDFAAVSMKFNTQLQILESAKRRFESSLFDITQLLQADLFDTEVEVAKELNKKGFVRASGVICGVVIEKHLSQVCINHNLQLSKKHPTIADYNDLLKSNNIIEVGAWRFIQRLADIRNLCGHNKDREPSKEEVEELINGTEKIIKTIY